MNWISTKDQEPPKDRVFIATGGFVWTHSDTHFPERPEKHGSGRGQSWTTPMRPEHTVRNWSVLGSIVFAIWMDNCYVDASSGAMLPNFPFWCEANNPISKGDLTSAIPPHGLREQFDGDARRTELEAEVAKKEEWVNILEIREDTKGNITQIDRAKESLRVAKEMRDRSYDPYPISR